MEHHISYWKHAALRVLDVRHALLERGEYLNAYQLPSNVFLYSASGKAQVLLDNKAYNSDANLVCHAGKGAILDIVQVEDPFEYYLIFYQALVTGPYLQNAVRRLRSGSPFQLQYGFAPQFPAPLFLLVEQMNQQWQQSGTLEQFQVKALFHQFVYELLKQWEEHEAVGLQPDVVQQAVRHMEDYYAEPITLHSLAAMLDCNPRQLQRLFKDRVRTGPIDYLIQLRLEKAKTMLHQTSIPLNQIAEAVGYLDSYHFSKMFKKYTGVSPSQFKQQGSMLNGRRDIPSLLSQYPIVKGQERRYSCLSEDENHSQYNDKGVIHMQRNTKSAAAMLMISLVMVLSACTGAGANTNSGGASAAGNSAAVQTQAPAASPVESKVRTIQHLKGELKLEQTPEKIVVLDVQYIDQLLALGEQPVGSVSADTDNTDFPEYLTDKLSDVKVLGTQDGPNMEAIIAAAPDLIICTEFQEQDYDKLVKIAPTIMFERNEDWRTILLKFGQIVDKEQEAQDVVDQYTKRTADLKAELAQKMAGQTVALIRPRDDIIRLHTTGHRTAQILYDDLGLSAPAMAVDDKQTSLSLSMEVLPKLQAEHLFLLVDDSNAALTEEFMDTSIWKNLSAVKDNHLYKVNTTLWIGYYGPIAINLVLDEVAEALL
ncbi:AraC family transcriptional regulator [Paenibacillus monticola]|uniref:AraC family transcriptional regulator n=1 Tax=Paenibacillus monticola TaxID=2666075 RepID=UPI0030B87F74